MAPVPEGLSRGRPAALPRRADPRLDAAGEAGQPRRSLRLKPQRRSPADIRHVLYRPLLGLLLACGWIGHAVAVLAGRSTHERNTRPLFGGSRLRRMAVRSRGPESRCARIGARAPGRSSSGVEHRFRKPTVVGSNPTFGSTSPQGEDSSLSWRSMSGCWLTLISPSCGRSRSMTSQRTAPSEITRTATMTGLRRRSSPALYPTSPRLSSDAGHEQPQDRRRDAGVDAGDESGRVQLDDLVHRLHVERDDVRAFGTGGFLGDRPQVALELRRSLEVRRDLGHIGRGDPQRDIRAQELLAVGPRGLRKVAGTEIGGLEGICLLQARARDACRIGPRRCPS